MKSSLTILTALLLVAASLTGVFATSFVQDCELDEYRVDRADLVFIGTVTDVTTTRFGRKTLITFEDLVMEKGTAEKVTIAQPAGVYIPSITLDWYENHRWRIQASLNENGDYILDCGEMSRQWAMGIPPPGTEDAPVVAEKRSWFAKLFGWLF